MSDLYIESRQNPQVKELVRLRERKHRERQQRFLIEGLRELQHAIRAEYPVEEIFYCPELFPSAEHATWITEQRSGKAAIEVKRMSQSAFEKAAYREGPDGILATAKIQIPRLSELKLGKPPLLLILEGIEKPGNLGAILRTADAAGFDAIILTDCVLDLFNPNAIRASQGLIFKVPVVLADAEPLRSWLSEQKIETFAMTPHATHSVWEIDYTGPSAFLMGSERQGLSDFWLQAPTRSLRIPMAGAADSLNVAAATAVCAFEARRQRSQALSPKQAGAHHH